MAYATLSDLKRFGIAPARGFLPIFDPLFKLPKEYFLWEDIAEELPELLAQGEFQKRGYEMRVLGIDSLRGRELYRAKLLLDFFASAYVWEDWQTGPRTSIPAGIAFPLCEVSRKLGRPPILSYASYALYNWHRIDKSGPIALENLEILQHFLGDIDEKWFILVHVQIEAEAAQALHAILFAQDAVLHDFPHTLGLHLPEVMQALQKMCATLNRMPEHCNPEAYYNRVRPYIHGWKGHPALPGGVIYQGVREFEGQPQEFRGETGAQSSIVPCLDAFLGIEHANDTLSAYLNEMQSYMPPKHRAFINRVASGPSLRTYLMERANTHPFLVDVYNECIQLLHAFRLQHLEYAASYVYAQAQKSGANPTAIGTGGTPFMAYLKKHADETSEYVLQ